MSHDSLRGFGMEVVEPTEYDFDPWNGKLLMWEAPQAGETYVLGVDPAEGIGGDNSACEVVKIGTYDHPDIQVAEFVSNWMDPVEFAEAVNQIGRFYSGPDREEAFLVLECNAACGTTMVNDLFRRLDYQNMFRWKIYDKVNNVYSNKLGWWTNRSTRPKIIARALHAFQYGDLLVNSGYLLQEMADFQRNETLAKYKALSGKHDDRVMALLMAHWGAHDEEWLRGEDVATERRLRARQPQDVGTPEEEKPKRDYQNTLVSFKRMMELANESMEVGTS